MSATIRTGSEDEAGSGSFHALVPAAGRGERFGGEVPKQFQSFAGRPLFVHALAVLAAAPEIVSTVVVVPAGLEAEARSAIAAAGLEGRVAAVVHGGTRRQDSVLAWIEGTIDGKARRVEFPYRRADCP